MSRTVKQWVSTKKWASSALAIHLSTIKAGRTRLFILNTKAEQDRNDFDKAGEAMMRVGLVGWRGMVGSMLLKRMREEGDFSRILPTYFSTSAAGRSYRDPLGVEHRLLDANSVDRLGEMDIIITCQGGDYTKAAYPVLRASGWRGFWIDAASAKRMDDDSIIALDPVNHEQVEAGIAAGVRNYIGGNCSITLAHRPDRAVSRRARRMDEHDDLPGGVGRRRTACEGTARPDVGRRQACQ